MLKGDSQAVNRCGGLSLVVDGFSCKQCNGTIQESDLAENLVVDRETYEFLESFCYLGDTLDGDGRVDFAATAKIRNWWIKFRDYFHF